MWGGVFGVEVLDNEGGFSSQRSNAATSLKGDYGEIEKLLSSAGRR